MNFSQEIHGALHVPNLSLDICKKEDEYYLIEFQTNYFGTYTLEYSDFYFKKRTGTWETIEEKSILEKFMRKVLYHILIKSRMMYESALCV